MTPTHSKEAQNKFHGTLLGLAVGDAMGLPLEFTYPDSFQPVNDMIGGGPFHLSPGMGELMILSGTFPGRKLN